MNTPSAKPKIWLVVRVTSGNFLERCTGLFDAISPPPSAASFPRNSEFASPMLSLATFGAGF